jgi:hypothetical protein
VAAFASESDFELHTGMSATETTWAALEAACDTVRDKVCQQIDVVTNDVVTLHGTGTRALTLPELPIIAVDSVTLDGVAVTDWTLDEHGLLWRDSPAWWEFGLKYVVTYDHGYTQVPTIFVRVACQLAANQRTPGALKSAGPFTVFDDPDAAILSALDRRVVKRVPVP